MANEQKVIYFEAVHVANKQFAVAALEQVFQFEVVFWILLVASPVCFNFLILCVSEQKIQLCKDMWKKSVEVHVILSLTT